MSASRPSSSSLSSLASLLILKTSSTTFRFHPPSPLDIEMDDQDGCAAIYYEINTKALSSNELDIGIDIDTLCKVKTTLNDSNVDDFDEDSSSPANRIKRESLSMSHTLMNRLKLTIKDYTLSLNRSSSKPSSSLSTLSRLIFTELLSSISSAPAPTPSNLCANKPSPALLLPPDYYSSLISTISSSSIGFSNLKSLTPDGRTIVLTCEVAISEGVVKVFELNFFVTPFNDANSSNSYKRMRKHPSSSTSTSSSSSTMVTLLPSTTLPPLPPTPLSSLSLTPALNTLEQSLTTTTPTPKQPISKILPILYAQFKQLVQTKYLPLYNLLNTIDTELIVIDPQLPASLSSVHRRIVIQSDNDEDGRILVTATFKICDFGDPVREVPGEFRILGANSKKSKSKDKSKDKSKCVAELGANDYRRMWSVYLESGRWSDLGDGGDGLSTSRGFIEKLDECFGRVSRLSDVQAADETDGEDKDNVEYVVECGICYGTRLVIPSEESGGEDVIQFPDTTCPTPSCRKCYHDSCLMDWFQSLPECKEQFGRVYGTCMYCLEGLSVQGK